jgi:hypothetical protein
VTADAFAQEWMAKIYTSFLQCFIRHMVNQARWFLFKKSVMPNSKLKGTHRQPAIPLSVVTNAFSFLPMSLLIFGGWVDVFRGRASFQHETQPRVVESRGSSCLWLTPDLQSCRLQVKIQGWRALDLPPTRLAPPPHDLPLSECQEEVSHVDNWLFYHLSQLLGFFFFFGFFFLD